MEKFIPYEKLSKKEKRKMDLAKRQTWGELNPVTRKPENSKAYNRNKARNRKREYHEPVPGPFVLFLDRLVHNTQPFLSRTFSSPFCSAKNNSWCAVHCFDKLSIECVFSSSSHIKTPPIICIT